MEGTLSLFDWRPAPPEAEERPGERRPRLESPESAGSPEAAAPALAPRVPTIIVFDCETTGIDFTRDQVIELCVQHGLGDDATSRVWRMKPAVPIHPAAQAVHGITMADLAACPAFALFIGRQE